MVMKQGFAPIIDENSRVLILGSLPGDESIRQQRYYAHPNNQFWKILSTVYGQQINARYECRVEFLRRNGLALWDVLRSAERAGSLDSAIRGEVANDFSSLFENYRELRRVAFNGGQAQTLLGRYIARQLPNLAKSLDMDVLPSTSGRHVLSFEEKVARWTMFLQR